MRAAQRSHSVMPCAPAIAAPRHIILDITLTPVDTFPSVSGGFAGHSNGKLLIFICLLDFCAGLHILEVGYVMICRSSWISTQKRTPSGVAAPDGVFLLVLTALAHQAVKPLAQIIGYYLCSDRLKKCDDSVHGLPPPFRDWGIGEGPQCQYNTSSDTIQQKATAYDHTVPAAAFLFFLPSTAFFVDKDPACYYNNVVKMALLCGFAAVQNK